jgi:hypothetical protein
MADSSSPTHPTDETVAAYLEAVLPASDRTVLEAHLGDCEYCRARLVLASRTLESSPRLRSEQRRRPLIIAALAAAAALAGVLLLPRPVIRPAVEPAEVRGAEQVTAPAVRIVGPLRGATIDANKLRFVWAPTGPDALYQVTVSAADGRMLWTERTSDTIAAPPGEILRQLKPGQRYFWRVDALLSTLRSATSADQPFQVSPK